MSHTAPAHRPRTHHSAATIDRRTTKKGGTPCRHPLIHENQSAHSWPKSRPLAAAGCWPLLPTWLARPPRSPRIWVFAAPAATTESWSHQFERQSCSPPVLLTAVLT